MNRYQQFREECAKEVAQQAEDQTLRAATRTWMDLANAAKYSYHFQWLGRPVIQYPQDIVVLQELIWEVQPTVILETGIAHGGSLILSASMLALLDYTDAARLGTPLLPKESKRRVIGVDIDIREHNRAAIEQHPLSHLITMIEGSSTESTIVEQVRRLIRPDDRVLVCLDSNHTHEHVLAELQAYAPLTSKGSYCAVFDTVIEFLPSDSFGDRKWGRGDNPLTAVRSYLAELSSAKRVGTDGQPLTFEIDQSVANRALITVAPDGFLKRT